MSAQHGGETRPWLILEGNGREQAVIELPSTVRLEAIRTGRAYGVVEDGDVIKITCWSLTRLKIPIRNTAHVRRPRRKSYRTLS